uniref:Uncharacterized protein n=1 Tax=Physcomitrium patens TaxID=3218 RepID=A0A2K1ID47_PHYPA|nr:hypothetical protein PHYPA_030684 [Physcomitrium patens]
MSPWPRMTLADIQRFVRIFSQVDTDQDGKITGEQARELFRNWQLPRDVLRHVWNLADQDGDNMLSVREFCTAVYLLEKSKEGHPLPSRLPTDSHREDYPTPDKMILSASQHLRYALATTPIGHLQYSIPIADLNRRTLSQKERAEYYRSKLQEIVLFNTRCHNKLVELTEKVVTLRRKVYSLSRQYEEMTKSVSEAELQVAAKHVILQQTQGRKSILSHSLLRSDSGNTLSDSYLQVHAP